MLRGSKPLAEEQRLKVFIYGPAGVGKTLAALQFPNAYIIDTAKETTRYWKQIQNTNSEVFYCSDPYEVMKELKTLRDEKHRFQTLVIDEATTLYQNLQRKWTDKFVAAQEERGKNSAIDLLEDFGFRYWDKVKRDWYKFVDLLRDLDMNVIVNAHQKDKYGSNQQIIGITSDTDKKDAHTFDFTFRLIKRGNEYKAITEKERILPKELDPEAKRFPKEFVWNYPNLLKFYYKEYIEKPTKNSELSVDSASQETSTIQFKSEKEIKKDIPDNRKEDKKLASCTNRLEEIKAEDEKITTHQATNKTDNNKHKNINNIDKIKELIKKEGISIKEFKTFLQNICRMKHINTLSKLTEREQNNILENWSDKVIPKYKESIKKNWQEREDRGQTNKPEESIENKEEIKYEKDKPLRKDQLEKILKLLEKEKISEKRFLDGFMIKKWEELHQEGANNIIKNFKVIIGAIKDESI